ncbi:MAG TPA: nucleotidyltransferase domain-containing protein [Candidatus Nanoarchaeia archaeon]|nr:nucleotidyltransferase domain-containing protein [Candidatus Nanoarchaeia archaeon]
MLTKTQLGILGLLLHRTPQTIRGIARSLKKSYPLVYNSIQRLLETEILVKEELPPAHMIRLSENIPITLLVEAEQMRREAFLQRHKWIRVYLQDVLSETTTSLFVLVIFGSYAQEKDTDMSDLDLLAIVPKKEDIQKMETVLAKPYTKVKKHIIVVDEADIKEMLAKPFQLNVGNEAVKENIILYGAEQFHYLRRKAKE